jgi:hypothetical protein
MRLFGGGGGGLQDLPVIILSGGPNSNDVGANRVL